MVLYTCQVREATLTAKVLPKVNGDNTHGLRKHLATSKQNVRKKFVKPLDKKQILCYNKDVRKRKGLKPFSPWGVA